MKHLITSLVIATAILMPGPRAGAEVGPVIDLPTVVYLTVGGWPMETGTADAAKLGGVPAEQDVATTVDDGTGWTMETSASLAETVTAPGAAPALTYNEQLCADLQAAKPWVEWGCSAG